MKSIGNDIYLQRGETWSLDVEITDEKGHPYAISKELKNPYLAITITAARYSQKGDYRHTYWLDLSHRYVEGADGVPVREELKRFTGNSALYVEEFTINEILATYGTAVGGNIVIDKTSENDVTNFLFFTDPNRDGNFVYKYLVDYTSSGGVVTSMVWKDYSFRFIKQFNTHDWVEQKYLYDMKLLAGESVEEKIRDTLLNEGTDFRTDSWDDVERLHYANAIRNESTRNLVIQALEEGVPLMPNYDTKSIILYPANLYVSANIQGGI